jgi:hypothetical protein
VQTVICLEPGVAGSVSSASSSSKTPFGCTAETRLLIDINIWVFGYKLNEIHQENEVKYEGKIHYVAIHIFNPIK